MVCILFLQLVPPSTTLLFQFHKGTLADKQISCWIFGFASTLWKCIKGTTNLICVCFLIRLLMAQSRAKSRNYPKIQLPSIFFYHYAIEDQVFFSQKWNAKTIIFRMFCSSWQIRWGMSQPCICDTILAMGLCVGPLFPMECSFCSIVGNLDLDALKVSVVGCSQDNKFSRAQ